MGLPLRIHILDREDDGEIFLSLCLSFFTSRLGNCPTDSSAGVCLFFTHSSSHIILYFYGSRNQGMVNHSVGTVIMNYSV